MLETGQKLQKPSFLPFSLFSDYKLLIYINNINNKLCHIMLHTPSICDTKTGVCAGLCHSVEGRVTQVKAYSGAGLRGAMEEKEDFSHFGSKIVKNSAAFRQKKALVTVF